MNLRITVTYPATDGSMPENVEVEWSETPAPGELMAVLDRLMMAPLSRALSFAGMSGTESSGPHCRRMLCGHRQSAHADGDGHGECETCDNPEKCESFVGGPA